MVYGGQLAIVPSDCDCIPTHFHDTAAVSGIASPINAAALLEALRFGSSYPPLSSLCLLIARWATNLGRTFGFALRRFFVSLSLFLLTPCLRCSIAISALHAGALSHRTVAPTRSAAIIIPPIDGFRVVVRRFGRLVKHRVRPIALESLFSCPIGRHPDDCSIGLDLPAR
jgi:hypothetical protein